MNLYPYSSAIVMNDADYVLYGGNVSDTTLAQRQAVYWIAERELSEDLETFLLPTIVTGTYLFRWTDQFLVLDHTYINRIIQTSFIDTQEKTYWSQAGTDNIYLSLRDDERGLVDIHWVLGNCNCTTYSQYPYKVQEVYEAGLPTGVANRPDIMLALTTYSEILMNEIVGYGNEAPGDIGVQQFSNQQYSEIRVKLVNTAFGASARAQFVKKLVEKYRRKRFVHL